MDRSLRIDLADKCNLRCVMCQAYELHKLMVAVLRPPVTVRPPVLHPDAFREQGPRVDAIVVATHGAAEVQAQCRRMGLHDEVIDAMPLIASTPQARHGISGRA